MPATRLDCASAALLIAVALVGTAGDITGQLHEAGEGRCQTVQVGGGGIQACLTGSGADVVVLAAGAGQSSRTWAGLSAELSSFATVLTFDRPGFGASDPGIAPRTPTRIASELEAVLDGLAIQGPVVLVGHSMGGLHVLHLAELAPDRVRGVVLLDTPPPDFEASRRALLDEDQSAQRTRALAEGLQRMPESARLERLGAEAPEEWALPNFPRGTPLIVVSADTQDFGVPELQSEHRALWIERSRDWLSLSDHADFVIAHGSGHMVHQEQPDLVIELVRRMITATDR